jgi:glycosyltransferase involved in cell wall biosynthesis
MAALRPIALDATYSLGDNLSGVGVYSRAILDGLAVLQPKQRFLHLYRAHRLRAGIKASRPSNCRAWPLEFYNAPVAPALLHGLNQRLPRRTAGTRTVCTFHDLFVMTGDYSTPEFRARFTAQAREAAARADLIIAVSAFTAAQVHDLLGVEACRLRVIHHGVRFAAPPPAAPRAPVILHVGAIQRRKNLVRLVEAFERAAPAPWRLALAGSAGYGAEETLARIESSPARGRIDLHGWVDDAALERLYQTAAILAFPSLDEGFGIPVIEAMHNGMAVVAARGSALDEVCGPAVLRVDPLDGEGLAAALAALVNDEALRTQSGAANREFAAVFTWDKAVRQTWAVYRELL